MKPSQTKATKQTLNTPTQKQSPLNYSTSHNYLKHLKQSSRYNTKLVSAKPEQNLNSPAAMIQKTSLSTQTPSRSSGKMVYLKTKDTTPCDPASAKSQLEKFVFEKSLEIDVYATHGHPPNTRGSSSTTSHANQRLLSLTPREPTLELQQQKILENFAKKSPTSSSQTQAKLLVMLQKDTNTTKNNPQAKTQQYNSPKVAIKNAFPTSSNKENINSLNSPTNFTSGAKSGSKKAARRLVNTSSHENPNLVNESSDTLRLDHPGLGSVEKEGGDRCANHPHKKAKYIVVPEDAPECIQENQISPENKYCSKCAIRFVGNGLKIQELLSSPQELRKSEVEEFLIRLSDARRSTATILESINKKRDDIGTFYSKQIEKAELIVSAFLKILTEEKTRALEELTLNQEQTFEEIEDVQKQVEDRLNSMTSIHHDIEKNLNNILNNIETKPFKAIMSKYNEKLDDYLGFIDSQVLNHQINVSKLPGFKQKALEDLRPTIITFFTKNNVLTSLIKREATQTLAASKNKRASQEDGLRENLNKNSLYISFENKEIFEDAVNSCGNSSLQTDQQAQNQVVRRCSDLYSYTYGQKTPHVRNDTESLSKCNDGGRGYNTLSNEPKGIVKKTDIDLGSYMDNKSVKTPQIVRNQQNASNTAHTKRPMSYQVSSEQRFLSNPSTSEFYGYQVSLQQSSFDATENSQDIPTSRYSNIGGNTSIQVHNRHESCPSPQMGLSSNQEATDSGFDTNFAAQSNRSTKKYINILEKISSNQSRKNAVYSDMLKSNTLLSPRYTTAEEEDDANELSKYSLNGRLENPLKDQGGLDNFGRPLERMTPDSGLSSRPDARTDNNPQKELKNYPPFFHFIESKINNEKTQQPNSSYQKTLFCCSPNFKENIEPTEEDP